MTEEVEKLETGEETTIEVCEIHGKYECKSFKIGESRLRVGCPACNATKAKEQKRQAEKERREAESDRLNRLFSKADIPPRFRDKSFEGYNAENPEAKKALATCKRYAEVFDQRLQAGGGLVLCGKPGTGKTHLAAAIANHVIPEFKVSVIFISVMSAMRRVKSTYSKDSQETESEAVRAYTMPDLLILDEVGVQFGSDAEKIILFEIINIRYQNMKPTILISNLSIDDLNEYIGERVIDRMREGGGAIIPFDWESYRGKA